MNIIDFACFMLVILVIVIALIKKYADDRKKGRNIKKSTKLLQKENKKQVEGVISDNFGVVSNEKGEGGKSCFFAPSPKTVIFIQKYIEFFAILIYIYIYFV